MINEPLAPGVLREAVIDTAAMTANLRRIREVAGVPTFAVVKADGYGHGAVRSARAALAAGAEMLGVTDLGEAFQLRDAGIDADILSWIHAPGTSFERAVASNISIGVSTAEQLAAASAAGSAGVPARVHLKLETGLSRNGIAPEQWGSAFAVAAREQEAGRIVVEGLFSHLSGTSDADDIAAARVFDGAIELAATHGIRPRWRHIAATGAALALPALRYDAVRIGLGLYGLSPLEGRTSAQLGLRPAMTLRAQVANVRRVPAGTGLSYGYTYRTEQSTTLVLVPTGYADGVPRAASNGAAVLIGDRTYPVAGRVAMDQFIVDVGDAPVQIGDTAVLFGDPEQGAPAVETWADAAGTINYEIVTRIGMRVPRREAGA